MPLLLVLNGPPAVGKSTLARRYVADHPLALDLDVDLLRGLLGRWQDDPGDAGLRARALALAMAAEHLGAGYDVVVPQLVARPPFLDQLEGVAAQAGAQFVEVVLSGDRDGLVQRFSERGPVEVTAEQLAELHDRLDSFVPQRPRATRLEVVDGDVERTYRAVLNACRARSTSGSSSSNSIG
ncbi:AAA family ATPase [Angustibacter sp. McL0619]|uniref:AAA family ATPase n=1 Tax=Angustibacter sp. McL0619 TaxID=3415676 RepID=UPI003CE79509